MRVRYRGLGLLLWLLLAGLAFAEPSGEKGLPFGAGTVRFDLYWNYLIVAHGSAGPLKDLTFLVDTGASPTVIDPQVARRLHLKEQPASIQTVGGMVPAARATVPSLSLGPVRGENLSVFVEDLSGLQKALPVHLDGVVGLDVLGQNAFVIDYRARVIRFGPLPAFANPLPLVMRDGLACVEAQVNGISARLMLDTGASSLTMFTLNAQHSLRNRAVDFTQPSASTIGEVAHRQMTLDSLRLGSTEFGRQLLSLVAGSGPAGGTFDGLLSPAAMGLGRVAIDLGRGQVVFLR